MIDYSRVFLTFSNTISDLNVQGKKLRESVSKLNKEYLSVHILKKYWVSLLILINFYFYYIIIIFCKSTTKRAIQVMAKFIYRKKKEKKVMAKFTVDEEVNWG
jgi:hypothetical protein